MLEIFKVILGVGIGLLAILGVSCVLQDTITSDSATSIILSVCILWFSYIIGSHILQTVMGG